MSSFSDVLLMSQTVLRSQMEAGPMTREAIAAAVDRVLAINPAWRETIDPAAVALELERRFDVWIGHEQVLVGNDDHEAWLTTAEKEGWRYWPRYRDHIRSTLSENSVDSTDRISDRVLGLLENPARPGSWDRRGLVVGHVQAGKTGNYTALICKAADAGYRLIVVLAGLHKNLRSQTQTRLDEGFLGYETMPPREAQRRDLRPVGVGLLDPTLRPDYVTNRSDNGDFSRAVANNMGINPGGRPLLFVVKKNVSVLKNLLDWVDWAANSRDAGTGRGVVVDVPLLVIDDEADQASVDTREQAFDEEGRPDPDHNPTQINCCVRRLLRSFQKRAYVGYTATPFANIFIHERGTTATEGDDLFPRSFIMTLPAPSDYAGPAQVFGLEPSDEGDGVRPLPLVRPIRDRQDDDGEDEFGAWLPANHKNGHIPLFKGVREIPTSLRKAVHAFLLACAARRARGQTSEHNSMLVHVTRFTSVQHEVYEQLQSYLVSIRRRLLRGEGEAPGQAGDELRTMWDSDFAPTTAAVRAATGESALTSLKWNEVSEHLPDVVQDLQVREVNGSAGDVLDYDSHKAIGLTVIAVGGDKLSRGLTLRGLSVSYFLRASRMYDTLMQMGRWFGYRPGYLDLCRLCISKELNEWFQHVTEANEELRQEFDHMVAVGGVPKDYGLKVRSHPLLMVTSAVKMRHGTTLSLCFATDTAETVVFHRDSQVIEANNVTTEQLLRELGPPSEINPRRDRAAGLHNWENSYLWRVNDPDAVLSFLSAYRTHPDAHLVNNRLLIKYIEAQLSHDELKNWTIVLFGNGTEQETTVGGYKACLARRAPNTRFRALEQQKREGVYIIRRLLSPRDVAIDLDSDEYERALHLTQLAFQADRGRSRLKTPPDRPSSKEIAARRDPAWGLLLLYPLAPMPAELSTTVPAIGFGISFPDSQNAARVPYEVNNVYWSQECEVS